MQLFDRELEAPDPLQESNVDCVVGMAVPGLSNVNDDIVGMAVAG